MSPCGCCAAYAPLPHHESIPCPPRPNTLPPRPLPRPLERPPPLLYFCSGQYPKQRDGCDFPARSSPLAGLAPHRRFTLAHARVFPRVHPARRGLFPNLRLSPVRALFLSRRRRNYDLLLLVLFPHVLTRVRSLPLFLLPPPLSSLFLFLSLEEFIEK